MIETKIHGTAITGALSLQHAHGFVAVDLEIPLAALTLPLDALIARYITPAVSAAIESVTRQLNGS